MKAKFLSAFITLSLGLQAQFEPFDQFFYKTLWDNIPIHDSVTEWYDSVSPQGLFGGYSMDISPSGNLDSMVYRDHFIQEDLYFHSGKTLGKVHVVASFYKDGNIMIPYQRVSFVHDDNGSVDYVDIATHNGSTFEETARMDIEYLPNLKVSAIHLLAATGAGRFPIGDYNYFYTNDRLDSMLTSYHFTGRVVEKYEPFYDNGGRIKGMHLHEYWGFSGGLDFTTRYIFHYNSAGQEIQYVEEHGFDYSDSTLHLNRIFEYSRRNGSTVSNPEHAITDVAIYPNPTADFLHIEGENLTEYRLFDLSGKTVLRGEVEPTIDLSGLRAGQYLLHLIDKRGNTAVRQIIKI